MKQILYLSQYYPPEIGAGAVRSEAITRFLSGDDWNVDVVCEIPNYPTGNIPNNFKDKWAYTEKISDTLTINRVWVKANQRRNFWQQITFFLSFMISSLLFCLMHPKKYDVVYVTSPPIFAGITGCILSRLFGSKFVFEIRDIWPDSVVNEEALENNTLFVKIGNYLERWLYRKADLLIPVTPASEKIIEKRASGTSTVVIPNGVDLNLFHKKTDVQSGVDEPINPNKFRVGYVGSLGFIHDLNTLIRAAKMCETNPDIEFIIVGDSGRNNRLQYLLDEYQPANVQWVGLKEHRQIPYYISSFDIAVNPVNNRFALESIVTVKFYEYLACEVPVITSAKGALRVIGEESGAAVTVAPGDADLLAEAILKLKADDQKRRALTTNSFQFVKERFDRHKHAADLSALLKNLV
ncbi:glycosyltransferase WbuB [Rhodohalobacter sp. SW132]|uniref:glycosyltransferase family 4 protein n=1 Tax=Rhodohalobacter sp. SW132 TaxID=2293433 RepID=UPI000E25EDA0|nr:glycosyltransferase family 4 protein [Rhodohalobacter sp. SW132]REL38444.1 glycosyltransferase WbuB [Rhodohalobacter sp. SW132]